MTDENGDTGAASGSELSRRKFISAGAAGVKAANSLLVGSNELADALTRAKQAEAELAKTKGALAEAQGVIAANASMAPEYMEMLKRRAENEIASASNRLGRLIRMTNEGLEIDRPFSFPTLYDAASKSDLSKVKTTQRVATDDIWIIGKVIADYEAKRQQFPNLPALEIPHDQRPEALTAKYEETWQEMMAKAEAIEAYDAACAEVRARLEPLGNLNVNVAVPDSATPEQDAHILVLNNLAPRWQQGGLDQFMRKAVNAIASARPDSEKYHNFTTEEIQALTQQIKTEALPAVVEHAVSEVGGRCMQIANSSAFRSEITRKSVEKCAAALQEQFKKAVEAKLGIGTAANLAVAAAAGALLGAAADAAHDAELPLIVNTTDAQNALMAASDSAAGMQLLEQLPTETLPGDWRARVHQEPTTAAFRTT